MCVIGEACISLCNLSSMLSAVCQLLLLLLPDSHTQAFIECCLAEQLKHANRT
jgi:hypothetical protein